MPPQTLPSHELGSVLGQRNAWQTSYGCATTPAPVKQFLIITISVRLREDSIDDLVDYSCF